MRRSYNSSADKKSPIGAATCWHRSDAHTEGSVLYIDGLDYDFVQHFRCIKPVASNVFILSYLFIRDCFRPLQVYGHVASGLLRGVPIAAALGDQMAALLGNDLTHVSSRYPARSLSSHSPHYASILCGSHG